MDREGPPPARLDGVMDTYALHLHWKDLQPRAGGRLATRGLDRALNAAAEDGERVKLRVLTGVHSPDWAKRLGGPPVHVTNPANGRVRDRAALLDPRSERPTRRCSAGWPVGTTIRGSSPRWRSPAAPSSTPNRSSGTPGWQRTGPPWCAPATPRGRTRPATGRRSTPTGSGRVPGRDSPSTPRSSSGPRPPDRRRRPVHRPDDGFCRNGSTGGASWRTCRSARRSPASTRTRGTPTTDGCTAP